MAQVRNCDEDGEPGVGRCPHKHRDSLDITDDDLGPSIVSVCVLGGGGYGRVGLPFHDRMVTLIVVDTES